MQATYRGVLPYLPGWSKAALAASSSRTLLLPRLQAMCKGATLLLFDWSTAAFAASSSRGVQRRGAVVVWQVDGGVGGE
eukprot:scaffold18079_cov65-Phaeocystis_antarctica.AAC.12